MERLFGLSSNIAKMNGGNRMKKLSVYFIMLFTVTFTFAETLSLQKGWNLMGIDSNLSLLELQEKVGSDNLLIIQGQKKTYQKKYDDLNLSFLNDFEVLEQGEGYWIELENNVSFDYTWIDYETAEQLTLHRGWNLINPSSDLNLSSIIAQLGVDNVKTIQGATQTYQQAYLDINVSLNDFKNFEEFQGYWIQVTKDLNLTFEQESSDNYDYIPENIDAKMATEFLSMTTFGGNSESKSELIEKGVSTWVDEQLAMPYVENMHLIKTINLSKEAEPTIFPETLEAYLADNDTVFNMSTSLFYVRTFQMSSWFDTALFEEDQLRHRVAYALSQIVVVSVAEPLFHRRGESLAAYMDILTKNAFGNYRDLLIEITHSPSMALYLTYNGSKKEQTDGTTVIYPDENYARELMQLFTLGLSELNLDGTAKTDSEGNTIPTYTQTDVNELAKVFTGWDLQDNTAFGKATSKNGNMISPLEFTEEYHDMGAKTLLGESIQAGNDGATDIEAAIDILMAHPNIAPFISKQLIMRLVKSNPTPEYVARVATVFNDNGNGVKGDLKAVVRAILLDEELWEDNGVKKFKEPLLAYTQLLRIFNVENYSVWRTIESSTQNITDSVYFSDSTDFLGQSPTYSPTVFNFYNNSYVPNDSYFKANNLVAPELEIQTDSVLIAFNNNITKELLRNEKGYLLAKYGTLDDIDSWTSQNYNGFYSLSRNKYFLDCSEEYNVIEAELESTVDGVFESFNGVGRNNDTSADSNGTTNRDRALLALIEHLDAKLTNGEMDQGLKDLLFENYKSIFYINSVRSAENPKEKIYQYIIVRIIVAIVSSETYMLQ